MTEDYITKSEYSHSLQRLCHFVYQRRFNLLFAKKKKQKLSPYIVYETMHICVFFTFFHKVVC